MKLHEIRTQLRDVLGFVAHLFFRNDSHVSGIALKTNDQLNYQSSIVRGSYFNRMLDCGDHNRWLEIALGYLPRNLFDENKEQLKFISMAHRDGCRLARADCETREIIILSEHILPKPNVDESHSDVRYFVYVVLHEVAHAIKKHRSPLFDSLTSEEIDTQESEADSLAMQWFNDHANELANPNLLPITTQEIETAEAKSRAKMKTIFNDE
jgi:hypothetical protein